MWYNEIEIISKGGYNMRIPNTTSVLEHVKKLYNLKNKELATILDVSDSTISYTLNGRFSLDKLDMILDTFNFIESDSAEAFNALLEKHGIHDLTISDFDYLLYDNKVYCDISKNETLYSQFIEQDSNELAKLFLAISKEHKSNLIFPNFDASMNIIDPSTSPSRIRFCLTTLCKKDSNSTQFLNVKPIGFTLSSSFNTNQVTFDDSVALSFHNNLMQAKAQNDNQKER